MSNLITLNTDATAGNGCPVALAFGQSFGNIPYHGGMPAVISRGQAFFWTNTWQEFEREAGAALEAGEYAEFEAPADAIRWLLSGED